MPQKVYQFFSDPSHGWLKVSRMELKKFQIEHSISPFSFQRKGFVYLEEDCDAPLFLKEKDMRGEPYEFRYAYSNKYSKIRGYSGYIPESFTFWHYSEGYLGLSVYPQGEGFIVKEDAPRVLCENDKGFHIFLLDLSYRHDFHRRVFAHIKKIMPNLDKVLPPKVEGFDVSKKLQPPSDLGFVFANLREEKLSHDLMYE